MLGRRKSSMVAAGEALPGRDDRLPVPERHTVLGTPLAPPYPDGLEIAEFALGCFWGAERAFWTLPGVYSTSVGYGPVTTEVAPASEFYYAEDYHQQYLDKNPDGYCGLGGTGASCPIGVARADG